MKQLIFTLISFIASTTLLAYDAEIEGIFYNFSEDEAEVTYKMENADNNYSGDVVIPEFVSFEGKEYHVTSIGYKAFSRCTVNISVSIPKSVKIIRLLAFSGCKGLTSISIPDGVESIEQHAFEGCVNLVSVDIPESVTIIESGAFYHCESLTSVSIPKGVEKLFRETFLGCLALSYVSIPESVKYIDTSVFHGCTSLTSIKIPDSVEKIHERVFENCKSLKRITLSENMVHLGSDAFWGCSNLTEITCKAQNPPATLYIDKVGLDRPSGVFYGVDKQNCKLYVPHGCEEAYRAASDWKDFDIMEMGTNIVSPLGKMEEGGIIYDLQGHMWQQAPQKGINIINGRKVLMQ